MGDLVYLESLSEKSVPYAFFALFLSLPSLEFIEKDCVLRRLKKSISWRVLEPDSFAGGMGVSLRRIS